MNIIHSRVNKSNLDTVPVVDGQIIYVKDTHELFFDIGSTRTKASDIIFVETLEERNTLSIKLQNKIYCVLETNRLYRYNGTDWLDLSGVEKTYVDNQDTATLNNAKTYTDNQDTATLNNAKTYTDNAIANYVPLRGFPESIKVDGTTQEFFESIKALNLPVGSMLLGLVKLTDLPDENLKQVEVQVEIYKNNVLYCTMRSADTPPYVWTCNSFKYLGWQPFGAASAETTAFDSTGTDLVATNVDEAIKALYTKITELTGQVGNISVALDEINGEIITE